MKNPSIEPLEARIAPAVLSFAGPVEIAEAQSGQSDMIFKVLLDTPSPTPLTVRVSTLDGTATAASGDYTALTDFLVEIPANTFEKTFVVKVNGDTDYEPNESFSVVLSSPSAGHTIGASSSATGTILRGADVPPTISVANASIIEKNDGTQQMRFTVSLSNKASEAVTFTWGTNDLPVGVGAAVAGVDYTAVLAGTFVTIDAGQTTANLVVDLMPDRIVEPNETFEVQISNPKLAVELTPLAFPVGSTGKAVGTIVNDEPVVSLELVSSPTPNEGTGTDTEVTFNVRLSVAASESVVVKLSTAEISATGGADFALAGTDFISLAGHTVTVVAGQTVVPVKVKVRADSIHEADEKFSLKIDEALMGALDLTPVASPLEVTIRNDEALPTLSVKGATLVEPATGTSVMNFVVSLSSAADKDVTFSWNTVVDTAMALDFTEVATQTATIPAGQMSVTLPVTILADTLTGEGNESFTVAISGGALNGQPLSNAVGGGTALGTIRSTPLDLSVVAHTAAVIEGTSGDDRTAVFKITRGEGQSLAETIVVRVSTVDGTATAAGNDFRPLDKALFTIPNGVKEIFVPVGINPDNIDEGDETFSLRIDSAEIGGANFQGISVASATATITDDDAAPTLSIGDASVVEGHSGTKKLAFVVSLSTRATSDITFTYVTELDTPSVPANPNADVADAADFVQVLTPETITIPAGASSKTVEITINGDTDREKIETFLVRIANAMQGTTALTISDSTGTMTIQPDEPIVTISGPLAAIAEGSTSGSKTDMTFTVRLDKTLAEPTAVRVSSVNGTAIAGQDFEAVAGKWVLIPAGSLTGTLTVSVLQDSTVENAEAFTVVVEEVKVGVGATLGTDGQPTGGFVQSPNAPIAPATGTINNDDLATLSIGDATVVEGNSGTKQMTFTVSLSKPASEDVTFRYATQNKTATGGVDFTAFSGVLGTIPAGQQSVTITVDVLGDTVDEADETFSVLLSEPRFATNTDLITLADGVGEGKILNDERTVSISQMQTVSESASGIELTITLSQASVSAVQVTLSLTNGTAMKGADFSDPTELVVTIPANSITATFNVAIINDAAFENDETFDVYLIGATNAQLGAVTRGTVTITSDDALPKLTLTGENKNEGTKLVSTDPNDFTDFTFTATLDEVSGSPVTFNWRTLALTGGDNATAGDDFTAVGSTLVTIPAGSPSATFVVKVNKEAFGAAVFEQNEKLTVEVSNVTGATVQAPDVVGGSLKTLVATIINDEPPLTVSVASVRSLEGNSGTSVMDFVVRLNERADRDVTFSWKTEDGTAAAGSDYTAVPSTSVTIPAGSTQVTLSVPITGDAELEADETFSVKLTGIELGGTTLRDTLITTGVIRNDEITARIETANAAITVTEGDDVPSTAEEEFVEVRIPITLSQAVPAGKTATVGWKFVTLGGTATLDTDFKADSFLVNFAEGEITKDIVVKIRPDLVSELDETFTVELNDDTTSQVAVDPLQKTSVVTIDDNENAPVISIKSVGGLESEGKLVFTVTMDRRVSTDVTVSIETVDGSAVSSGLQKDFTAKALETLTFLASESVLSKTFEVLITNDLDDTESLENFVVRLSNAVGATLSSGAATMDATGTIGGGTDSSIKIGDVTVVEGSTPGTPTKMEFVVTRTGNTTKAVTGDYAVSFDALLAAGFTNAEAADIVSGLTGSFTIPAGENSAKITLEIVGDAIVEGDQRFRVSLSNVAGAFQKSSDDLVATGTITDDDLTIRFRDSTDLAAPSVISLTEGNSATTTTNMVFFVDLNAPAPKDTLVTFVVNASGDNPATKDTDFKLQKTTDATPKEIVTITIPAGATSGSYIVQIVGDQVGEKSETFTVGLVSAVGATIDRTGEAASGTKNDERTGKIVNDDAAFEIVGKARVVEGQSGTRNLEFQVKLSDVTPVSGTEYSVNFAVTAGTAQAGQDFTATSGTLTFTDNGIKTVLVPVFGDTAVENDETMTLTLTDSKVNAQAITAIVTATALGTIQDDETSVFIGNAAITEGNAGQQTMDFIVNIPLATTIPIVVKYSTVDVEATGAAADATDLVGKDYRSVVDGTVTIAPGQTRATISIPVFGDLVQEGAETFKVRITEVSGGVAPADPAEGTGTIADNGDVAPTLSIANASITESDSGSPVMKFKVSLTHAASVPVTFDWATVLGSAAGSADTADIVEQVTHSATIPVGKTFIELEVPVKADVLAEGNETFSVTLSSPKIGADPIIITDNDADTSNDQTAEGVILDDDGTLRVKAGSATVTALEDSNGGIGYKTDGALAKNATSIKLDTGTGAINVGDKISFGTDSRLYMVKTALASGIVVLDGTGLEEAVSDDAVVHVYQSVAKVMLDPGAITGAFTVTYTLTAAPTGDASATSKTDYAVPKELTKTFPAGTNVDDLFIEVNLKSDIIDEWDEKFTVTITGATGLKLDTTADNLKSVVSITDNDEGPKLELSNVTVLETSGAASFVVKLVGNVTERDIVVSWEALSESALSGLDFNATTAQTLTIAAGQREGTMAVTITNDSFDELDETFRVAVTDAKFSRTGTSEAVAFVGEEDPANLGTKHSATGTIRQNDLRTVSVTGGTVVEGAAGAVAKTIDFKIRLDSAPSSTPITVNYGTVNGTALGGEDFTAAAGSVTFQPGETEKTVSITVTPDDNAEADETMELSISLPVGSLAQLGTVAKATGTIESDESVFKLERVIAPGGSAVVTEGGVAKFKIVRTGAIDFPATVSYSALEDATAIGDVRAKAAADFVARTGTITFAANVDDSSDSNQFIEITTVGDSKAELDERFLVQLTNVTNGVVSTTDGKMEVLVTDDDFGSAPPFVEIEAASVSEGGVVEFKVKLVNAAGVAQKATSPVVITYEGLFGTANAADFTSAFPLGATNTLEIPIGQSEGKISIATLQDVTPEQAETFSVKVVKAEIKLVESSATATETTAAVSPITAVKEVQTIDLAAIQALPTDTTFKLKFGGVETTALAQTATAAQIQTALNALSSVKATGAGDTGTVTVTGTGASFTITFEKEQNIAGVVSADALGGSASAAETTPGRVGRAEVKEVQTIDLTGVRSVGADTKYSLTFGGEKTSLLRSNATATEIAAALNALNSVKATGPSNGGTVIVTGAGPSFDIQFAAGGSIAGVVSANSADISLLTDVARVATEQTPGTFGIKEVQSIDLTSVRALGDGTMFTLKFGGMETAPLLKDATRDQIQDALNTLTSVKATGANGSGVVALSGTGPNYSITFEADGNIVGSVSANSAAITEIVASEVTAGTSGVREVQSIDLAAVRAESAGPRFVLQFGGEMTVPLSKSASPAQIAAALNALSSVKATGPAGSGTVTLSGTGPLYSITFGSAGNVSGVVSVDAPVSGKGTILNDDSTITVANVAQAEGNGGTSQMTFLATIPQVATFDVKFHYKTRFVAGSATSADFTSAEGDVIIPAGQTEVPFSITVVADLVREGNETFEIVLSAPVDGILANTNADNRPNTADDAVATVIGTIQNDDAGPQLVISQTSIAEGNTGTVAMVFTVRLEGATSEPVTVDFATSDVTASASGAIRDYLAKEGVLTFAPQDGLLPSSKGISVTVFGDSFKEGDETFKVTLSNATGGADIVTASAQGEILDGDDSEVGVYLSDTTTVEGSAAQFKIGFTALPASEMTFKLSTRNGTANSSDFTQISGQTFTLNGSTLSSGGSVVGTVDPATRTATISVATTNDTTFEATENFHLDLSAATGGKIAGSGATAVIYNDDFRIVNAREFEFIDEDGDLVNVKVSKGSLFTRNAFGQFVQRSNMLSIENAGSVGGKNITSINLLGTGREFEGANIFVTRKAQAGFDLPTDGKVNVGSIIAAEPGAASLLQGVNLGTVKVDGDLGRIVVGSTLTPAGISKIDVGSLGVRPTIFNDTVSSIYGRTGSILVRGNVEGALQLLGTTVSFATGFTTGLGSLGSLTVQGKVVGGSVDNSGYISSNARIGKVTVGGIEGGSGANSGQLFVTSALGSFTALGDVKGGSGTGSGQVIAGSIGKVEFGKVARKGVAGAVANIVGGGAGADLSASSDSIFAQVGSGAIVSFNGIKSVKMNPGSNIVGGAGSFSGMIFSNRSVSKVVLGDVTGGAGDNSGRVRIFGSVGSLSVGTIQGGAGDDSGQIDVENKISVATIKNIFGPSIESPVSGDIVDAGTLKAGDLGTVLVTGSMKAGEISGADLVSTGTIVSRGSISSLTVKGSVEGLDEGHRSVISVAKNIGRMNIGTLKFAEILAGYTAPTAAGRGALTNGDAQIGIVSIGDFVGSSIVAGIDAGPDDDFGTSDDIMPTSGVLNAAGIISRIASITIKTVSDVNASGASGLVAQDIGLVKVGGSRVTLNPAAQVPLPGTQVFINEV